MRFASKDTPSISDRAIAGMLGVDHKTVGSTRIALENGGEIPHQTNVTGVDGVKQPKRKKPIRTTFIDDTPEGQPAKYCGSQKRDGRVFEQLRSWLQNEFTHQILV
jgi:hypothetical protein